MKRSGREGRWETGSSRARFALEAAFLVVVAVGAALLGLSPLAIIVLMNAAWLLVAFIERATSYRDAAPHAEAEPEVAAEEVVEPHPVVERPSRAHVRRIEARAPAEVPSEPDEPEEPLPVAEPIVTRRHLDLSGIDFHSEPGRAVAAFVKVARSAEPEQQTPAAEASIPPSARPTTRADAALAPSPPREWNLWELERTARLQAGDDLRDEEWAALFMHLRGFADADGLLPLEFDGLVRESFAELIHVA
jgi:hypothetical protein